MAEPTLNTEGNCSLTVQLHLPRKKEESWRKVWRWSPSPGVSFQPNGCISMTLVSLSAHPLPTPYCQRQRLRQGGRVGCGSSRCFKAAQLINAEGFFCFCSCFVFYQYDPGVSCSPGAERSPPPHLFAPLSTATGMPRATTHCCKFCVCVQARTQLRFFLVLEVVAHCE